MHLRLHHSAQDRLPPSLIQAQKIAQAQEPRDHKQAITARPLASLRTACLVSCTHTRLLVLEATIATLMVSLRGAHKIRHHSTQISSTW